MFRCIKYSKFDIRRSFHAVMTSFDRENNWAGLEPGACICREMLVGRKLKMTFTTVSRWFCRQGREKYGLNYV